jgi:phosphoglycolate phosphatase-like HAD superfamily hydrolase
LVFDIDGTLTQTKDLDDSLYLNAIQVVMGLSGFDSDWANYPHATDSGLVTEIPLRCRGTPATPAEQAAVKDHFLRHLEAAANPAPPQSGPIREVPGAINLIATLRQAPTRYQIAIATGAWRRSGEIKLQSAFIPYHGLPLATADDAVSRADITRTAIARALDHAKHSVHPSDPSLLAQAHSQFNGIVYIGDGKWDARTSLGLHLGFIGLRIHGDFHTLTSEGARIVLQNYTNPDAFFAAADSEARVSVTHAAQRVPAKTN